MPSPSPRPWGLPRGNPGGFQGFLAKPLRPLHAQPGEAQQPEDKQRVASGVDRHAAKADKHAGPVMPERAKGKDADSADGSGQVAETDDAKVFYPEGDGAWIRYENAHHDFRQKEHQGEKREAV